MTQLPNQSGQNGETKVHRSSHTAMASPCDIFIIGEEEAYARQACRIAFEEMDRVEKELSRFIPYSDISRINSLAAGESVPVGQETMDCLKLAARICAETGGALDVTVGALMNCFRDEEGSRRVPPVEELAAARSLVGMQALDIHSESHSVGVTRAGVTLDLGAIGKGHGVDRMAEMLREYSIGCAMVHSGTSSICAIGAPPDTEGWGMHLRDPEGKRETLGMIRLKDRCMGGSGVPPEGPHILDPRTGEFVEGKLAAWVTAPSAALADAISTAFMVMSLDEIGQYCRTHPEIWAAVALRNPDGVRVLQFPVDILITPPTL